MVLTLTQFFKRAYRAVLCIVSFDLLNFGLLLQKIISCNYKMIRNSLKIRLAVRGWNVSH